MTALPEPRDLSSKSCSCHAYLHGAQVVDWTPSGAEGVLWLSPLATLDSAAAIRGGVPLVFPWFGPGMSGTMTPAHGFGRVSQWRLESVEAGAGSTIAVFGLDSSMATSDEFRHDYSARYVVRAGQRLELQMTITNTGATSFAFEEVFHAYLAVGDVHQVTIEGLDGAEYVDKVGGSTDPLPVQSGLVTLGTEVDRVYRSSAEVRVVDPVLKRVLVVRKAGSGSTVVWNPGAAKAAAAADIGPDHWREFVCVEAGNVQADAITLDPGQSTAMTCTFDVEPYSA